VLPTAENRVAYAKAALANVVSNFVVRAGGNGDGTAPDILVEGGKFYAPFVIANGGTFIGTMLDAIETFWDTNPNNNAATAENFRDLVVTYFSFGEVNPDHTAHIKSFGNTVFGFEDLPAGVGVSDYDFNDMVFAFG
jgi:Domain of unknown function (DUF4114)